ncbi:MAG: DUF2232 domain-containing protein [Candidatus Cloacimonetes bacterium]|nr:DUF2232 domain-containing protein [Candidatus Cloacimonadota bacterium]HPM00850.1 DUF2232 domain-containing protein [Candidatus Cloacimonadota bacterium]
MLIFSAVLGLMISVLSPVLGLMYFLPQVSKQNDNDRSQSKFFFLIWLLGSLVLYITKTVDINTFVIINLNVALITYVFLQMHENEFALETIMTTALAIAGSSGVIKYLFFKKSIEDNITLSVNSMSEMIQSRYAVGSEEYQLINDTLNVSKELYLKYNYSFAVFTILVALWIAIIIINRKLKFSYDLRLYSNMNYLVMPVIAGLGLIIYKPTSTLGINLILPCLALYFIQGLSIVWFYFGKMIANSKMLIVISIISLLINPYLILMISFIGFVDNWADLRKLNKMEETHENNTH